MALKVTVKPFDLFDPALPFKKKEAQEELEFFKAGATLHVWRRSSPHNWWLEQGDTEVVVDAPLPLTRLGKAVGVPGSVIAAHPLHRDGGRPESESWVYDPDRATRQEQLWNEFIVRKAYHDANPEPFAPDLDALSPLALALFRSLKRTQGIGLLPFPELTEQYAELRKQGLLVHHRVGRLMLNAQAAKVKAPKGDFILFKLLDA